LSGRGRVSGDSRPRRLRGPRGPPDLSVRPEPSRVVPREVSAAEVIATHAPGSPRREEGAAGKAPGSAPDQVAKGRQSMNTRVRSLPVMVVLVALLGPTVGPSGGTPRADQATL